MNDDTEWIVKTVSSQIWYISNILKKEKQFNEFIYLYFTGKMVEEHVEEEKMEMNVEEQLPTIIVDNNNNYNCNITFLHFLFRPV